MRSRKVIVDNAKAWLGRNEADGSHREIVDIYNSQNPLPRGYKLSYYDPWCAGFVSAVAIKSGYTDIIPCECYCPSMIQVFMNMGRWVENDAYVPSAGDIIFYDWDDDGVGDNTGVSDHVGIVAACDGSTITVIEGNFGHAVQYRQIAVNNQYIRGFGVPNYDSNSSNNTTVKTSSVTELKYGSHGEAVKTLQKNLNKVMNANLEVDGSYGKLTEKAVKDFQKKYKDKYGLIQDGIFGEYSTKTMSELLSVKPKDTSYSVVITADIGLNVRSGAGTQYPIVTAYPYGYTTRIYEVKGNWGRCNEGWLCLDWTSKV